MSYDIKNYPANNSNVSQNPNDPDGEILIRSAYHDWIK